MIQLEINQLNSSLQQIIDSLVFKFLIPARGNKRATAGFHKLDFLFIYA